MIPRINFTTFRIFRGPLHIPQTSNWSGNFFAASYSKPALNSSKRYIVLHSQTYLEKEMLATLNAGFSSEKIDKDCIDFILIFRL